MTINNNQNENISNFTIVYKHTHIYSHQTINQSTNIIGTVSKTNIIIIPLTTF